MHNMQLAHYNVSVRRMFLPSRDEVSLAVCIDVIACRLWAAIEWKVKKNVRKLGRQGVAR